MKEVLKEKAMLAATAGRLYQALDYSKRVKEGRPVKGLTAAIIGIDIADGIIARKLGLETPNRRVVDSVVDSAIITTGLWSTHKKYPNSRPFTIALAAREAFVGAGWALDLKSSKQVKKGDDFHKLPSLSIAAFCLAANHGSERAMKLTGVAAVAINTALAYDYYKGWTEPERNRVMDNGVEEVPGFYDVRVAASNFIANTNLLGNGNGQALLAPVTSEPYIDSTCIELE